MKNELTRLKESRKPQETKTQRVFSDLLFQNENDIHKTNWAVFSKIGSCQESGFLLGHIDNGNCFSNFIKRHFSFILALLDYRYVLFCLLYSLMLSKSAIYAVDIVKDVKFVIILNSVRLDRDHSNLTGLLDVAVSAAIGFLILSEIIKMVQIYHWAGTSLTSRLLRVILSPLQLVSILIHHYERKSYLKLRKLTTRHTITDTEQSLTQTRDDLTNIRSMMSEQRATENVLEHFVQFVISVAVLAANRSKSDELKIVDLSDSDFVFSVASSVISMFSMVRGQMNLISRQKNGQLGIFEMLLVGTYLTVGILTRAGIVLASIVATYHIKNLGFAHILFIVVTLTVALLHIILSFLVQKWLLNGKMSGLKQSLWSFLSPPLYLDWEHLYRKYRRDDIEMPIPKCLKHTMKCFYLHNILTLVGNIALGIPVFICAYYEMPFQAVNDNNADGLRYVKMLSFITTLCTLILAVLSQVVQIGLGYLYLNSAHPWARILNVELAKTGQDGAGESDRGRLLEVKFGLKCFLFPDVTDVKLHEMIGACREIAASPAGRGRNATNMQRNEVVDACDETIVRSRRRSI